MTQNTIVDIVTKARQAQKIYEKYSQDQIDMVVTAVAWAICNPKNNEKLSKFAVSSTGLGKIEDKIIKNRRKTLGLLRDLKKAKTVGVILEDKTKGIVEIAKPVGVIGAITPSTNPVATPMNNILNALKCGNAIIVSPSPAGLKVFNMLLNFIHEELAKLNAPLDLVQAVPDPVTKDLTKELMRQVDLVIVTGSQNNVREAYSSGTPAIGVGAGNATVIVDETSNLQEAAAKIKASKIFDNSTSCSSENNLVIVTSIYDKFVKELQNIGGLLLNADEKKHLQSQLWIDGKLNRKILAKTAFEICKEFSLTKDYSENNSFIIVEEIGVGKSFPFSGEKLSPVLTIFKAKDFNDAKKISNQILEYQGKGHSIGIHSKNDDRVLELGLELPVCRVIVNQAHTFATGGSFRNSLPFSLSMGCGTWGENSIYDNLNYKHFLNLTRIVREIDGTEPGLKDYFQDYCSQHDSKNLDQL